MAGSLRRHEFQPSILPCLLCNCTLDFAEGTTGAWTALRTCPSGNERCAGSRAAEKTHMAEMGAINRSLSTLTLCIQQLARVGAFLRNALTDESDVSKKLGVEQFVLENRN